MLIYPYVLGHWQKVSLEKKNYENFRKTIHNHTELTISGSL